MKRVDNVTDLIKRGLELENAYLAESKSLGWKYTDVLYSFYGIYAIGLNVFYNEKYVEPMGLVIRPIDRTNNRQQAKSSKYINANLSKFKKLNELSELKEFIEVSHEIGNLIPIWPGGNVHKGSNQCYDIPDIYFNRELIKTMADNYFEVFHKETHFLNKVKDGQYCTKSVEDFISFSKEEYKAFLTHIVKIISLRGRFINEYLNRTNV